MNTKLKALLKQIESGKMETDVAKILSYVITNRYTSRPLIADGLNMKLQTVVGRVSDLLDMGILEAFSNEGDEYEILQYQADPLRQAKNAVDRKKKKFERWKKRGINEFGDFLDLSQLEFGFSE